MSFIPANRVKQNGKVDIWDMGPPRPELPAAPIAPDKARMKSHEFAAAEVEHEDALLTYKEQLRTHAELNRQFREWHGVKGGPVKIELWGVDARHAMEREPKRYALDLPKDKAPGKAQREAEEMAEAEAEALQRARQNDPQFGQPAGAPA